MRFPRLAAASAAVLAGGLLFLTGCGTGESATRGNEHIPKVKTGTLEDLAAITSCKPKVQVDADELRQGVCEISKGRFVLTTFASSKGQSDWLSEAQPYGGSYLIGKKWVAVGELALLKQLRGSLGGRVETVTHGGHGSGGADTGGKDSDRGRTGHTMH